MNEYPEDDESGPSSPQDSELSVYSLRMLHSMPPSPNQLRKQAQLHERTEFLRRKNADIKQKVQRVRERQELVESMASSNMIMQLSQANERRQKHLKRVQERARTLRSTRKKQKLSLSVVLDVHTELSEESDLTREERDYSILEVQSVRVIQRAVREKHLRLALADKSLLQFIDEVLSTKMSHQRSVTMLAGDATRLFQTFLRALRLPSAGQNGNYSWFLYSVALITDFHESTELSATGHPGFNVNVKSSSRNGLLIHLPIILYRLALQMFCEFKKLFRCSIQSAELPISIPRLRIARLWRHYHYFFLLFKLNHRSALRDIAQQALDIASTHERIMRALDRTHEKGFRQRAGYFDRSMRILSSWKQPQNIEWASTGIDPEVTCKDITRAHRISEKEKERTNARTEMFYDPFILADDSHRKSPLTFSRGSDSFVVPPNVDTLSWRKHFLDAYSEELKSMSQLRTPLQLHTGSRMITHKLQIIDLKEVMKLMSSEEETPNLEFFHLCDQKLRSLFKGYYSFCKLITEPEDLEDTLKSFHQLCSLYNSGGIESVGTANARTYLKLFILLLMQLLLIASVDSSAALEFVLAIENCEDVQLSFKFLYKDLSSVLNAKWASHCAISSVQNFIRFENIYQMAGSNCLRDDLGLNFPALRFSPLYEFIYMNSRCYSKPENIAISAICGTQMQPQFEKEVFKESTLSFFQGVLMNFFVTDCQTQVNEKLSTGKISSTKLFSLFQEEIQSTARDCQILLILSIFASTLNLNKGISMRLKEIIMGCEDLELSIQMFSNLKESLSNFQWHYLQHLTSKFGERYWELPALFEEKLLDAFLAANRTEKLNKNFQHFSNDCECLYSNISQCCEKFYLLYYPILNWIHMDLGSPDYTK